jgi:hypothetical protein
MQVASQDKSFEFAPEVIDRAVSWFKEQTVQEDRPLGQILARLIFDSLMPSQLAPVRSGLLESIAPAGRQVLYNAGEYDVDLRFERGEDTNDEDLIGQILPEAACRARSTELTSASSRTRSKLQARTPISAGSSSSCALPQAFMS